jgi:limonene-1,2-epoxide hydrolase
MTFENDLMRFAAAFEEAFNRHAIDEVMAMFADDAVMEIEGVTRLTGKSEIRSMLEYDAGVNTHLQLVNRSATADMVTCQIVETNDRISVAGLDVLLYTLCEVSFENMLIRIWRTVPEPRSTHAFSQFWGAVRPWIATHYPTDYSQLFTHDGQFVRNRANGERIVQLARHYRSAVA